MVSPAVGGGGFNLRPGGGFFQKNQTRPNMASQKSKTSFHDLINGDTPVLIDFYADWCGPCKAFAPMLEQLKNELGGKARIIKIDVDRNQELSSALGVQSIPTVMIFQNGDLKFRGAGVQPVTRLKQEIEALV